MMQHMRMLCCIFRILFLDFLIPFGSLDLGSLDCYMDGWVYRWIGILDRLIAGLRYGWLDLGSLDRWIVIWLAGCIAGSGSWIA
jgi:hypothetical protein